MWKKQIFMCNKFFLILNSLDLQDLKQTIVQTSTSWLSTSNLILINLTWQSTPTTKAIFSL